MNLFLSILFFCTAAFSQAPSEYILGPGDNVSIEVHGETDFGNGEYTISSSGEISLPHVGRIQIADLSAFEAEERLRSVLLDGYLVNPQVSIKVTNHNSQRVDVIGAVGKPGVYVLEGPTSIRQLLTQAGGVEVENSDGFIVIRRQDSVHKVSIRDLEQEKGDYPLQGGDVVEIQRGTNIFLAGAITKPGALVYIPGITVSQAIIRAGGRTKFSHLAGSYIIRGDEKIPVNVRRILKGKDADLALMPGDRIIVPQSAF